MTNSKSKLIKAGLESALRRNSEVDFRSNFKFIQSHNGWRKGLVHVLLGTPGGGKSTIARSLLKDMLDNNPKTKLGVWLSEETAKDFKMEMFRHGTDVDTIEDFIIFSEVDCADDKKIGLKNFLEQDFDFLIFDNITTSAFYDCVTPGKQVELCSSIKAYASGKNIPALIIAHTSSDISNNFNRQIKSTDIRGVKTLSNLAEFFFVLQSFSLGESQVQFLNIEKHRSQNPKHKLYRIEYDYETRHYTRDTAVDFESFKDIFKQRNKL